MTLKSNASRLVIELHEKWHATIRSYAYSYLDYSQREFGLHSQTIIEAIENRIANKAFRYEPFPLQDGVVRKYLQTHIVETRSRWCRTWRRSGYKDGSKPRSCPEHVWKSNHVSDFGSRQRAWRFQQGCHMRGHVCNLFPAAGQCQTCPACMSW